MRSHSLTAHAATQFPAPAPRPAVRQKAYLYAIIAGAQDKVYGGFGIHGHDVYSVPTGTIAAVISDLPNGSVRPERAHLVFGLTCVITGVPAPTAKPLLSVTASLPVVRVTLRFPTVAVASTERLTVTCVLSATVTELMVMPVPKLAEVVPCTKCVY